MSISQIRGTTHIQDHTFRSGDHARRAAGDDRGRRAGNGRYQLLGTFRGSLTLPSGLAVTGSGADARLLAVDMDAILAITLSP